jgi:hypothetical protein
MQSRLRKREQPDKMTAAAELERVNAQIGNVVDSR